MTDEAIVWRALEESLLIFGTVFRDEILHDLNSMNRDNPSHGTSHLDMEMISECLKRHFGLDAYELIMNRLIAKVHELESISATQ
ncbi:MAG: hypothetical protein ACREBU_02165 [Nitrososphaera sp.]